MPSFTVPGYVQSNPQPPQPPAHVDVGAIHQQILTLLREEMHTSLAMIVQKITEHDNALQEIITKIKGLDTQIQEKAAASAEMEVRLLHLSDTVHSREHYLEGKEDEKEAATLNRPRTTAWKQRRKPPLPPLAVCEPTICEPEQHYHQPTSTSHAHAAVSAAVEQL